jgi:hypothetical protein
MRSSRRGLRFLVAALVALLGLRAALPLLVEIALERVLSGALAARVEIDDTSDGLPNLRIAVGAFALDELELARPEPDAPLRWGLGSGEMHGWQIGIAPDRGDPLDFELRTRAGAVGPNGALPIELELIREHGGRMALRGDLRPDPVELSLHASWEGIRSKALLPFL